MLMYFSSSKDGKWVGLRLNAPIKQYNGGSRWAGSHRYLPPQVDLPGSRLPPSSGFWQDRCNPSTVHKWLLLRETVASLGLVGSGEMKLKVAQL